MAETLINSSTTNPDVLPDSDLAAPSSSGSSSLFHRRIEFHLARKPFVGFTNGGGNFQLEILNPNATSCSTLDKTRSEGSKFSASAGKKVDGLEFLDNGLDSEHTFGFTFRRIGAGLENLGNTCFLNSVLQCLTYTEPLAVYLQSGKHQTSCRTAGFCALCAIQKHVSRALQSTGRILAPKDLVSNLRCISRNFRNARQEDAHEYMVNLLESMHKCCLPSGVPSESPCAYEKSLVHKIFGGRLRSQVKCMQCSFCSNKFDPFLDLSLEIIKADSLYKALAHFTAKEQLDGGEKQYQCQQCKQKVRALKQLTIFKAPYVLTIHLKRFGSQVPGQKIDKKIQFGSTLDLKPFVTGPSDEDLKYTLYGVLVHAGWSTHSGHYYCFVRTSSGMWYSLDDNEVVQVSEKKVLEQKAYMLFYVRDRRNFASRKPADFVQKEKITVDDMRTNPFSNFNQESKKTALNGLVAERLNNSLLSMASTQKDALNPGAMKGTPKKEACYVKGNDPLASTFSSLDRDSSAENLTLVPPLKDPSKELPILNLSKGQCLQQSSSSAKGSESASKLDGSVITTADGKIVECNVGSSTKQELTTSVAVPPNSISLDNKGFSDSVSLPSNCSSNSHAKKNHSDSVVITPASSAVNTSSGKMHIWHHASFRKDPNEERLEKIDCVSSLNQSSSEVGQVEILFKENAAGDLSGKGVSALAKLSSLPTRRMVLCEKPIDLKLSQKPKKRRMKICVTTMHLGTNILRRTSLVLRIKKKLKNNRLQSIKNNNLGQECLPDAELTPSFEKRKTELPGISSDRVKRRARSDLNKKGDNVVQPSTNNSSSPLSMGVMDEGFSRRVYLKDTVLATSKQSQNSLNTTPERKQFDAGEPNILKDDKKAVQNGLLSMLTRGLEEAVVSDWVGWGDGTELASAEFKESRAVRSVSIGYIGDEWDEEYDRGKRKKVRTTKTNFDGPNPFQEIATKRARVKGKMDQSRYGNQPFRI